MGRRRALIAALLLLAAGCAGGPPAEPVAVSDLRCDNGAALRVE